MGSTALFKTATIFSGALLVGHIRHGLAGGLYKAWGTSLTAAASTSAATGWDYMNVGFLLHGLLNWRWAKTGGPQSVEEKGMLLVLTLGGLTSAWRFGRVGDIKPAVAMGLAPLLSVLGLLL